METNPQTAVRLAYLGWSISLVIHIVAIMNYVFLSDIIPMLLFMLILFIYLKSSRRMREIFLRSESESIWRWLLGRIPSWMVWALGGFMIYAIVNFTMYYVGNEDQGYINFDVSPSKLRIVSGVLTALFSGAVALTTAMNYNDE